jgi:outer membrane protein assembly factor BamB
MTGTRIKFFIVVSAILFLYSCQKTESDSENTTNGSLTPFSVTVLIRTAPMAIISWTDAVDLINGNPVRYKIFLNNTLIDSNLNRTRDTLTGLSGETIYYGRVLAYTAQGDTASAPFLLEKVQEYIAFDSENHFEEYNLSSGTRAWSKPWNVYSADDGSSTIVGDTIYFSNNQLASVFDQVYAANLKTGAPIWSANYPLVEKTNPVVDNDKIFISSWQGLVSLNRHTGQVNWNYINSGLYSTPVVSADKIFVFSISQHMLAVNKSNGTVAWQFPVEQTDKRPLLIPGQLVFGTINGNVYALNQATGTVTWQRNFPGSNSIEPIFWDNNLIVLYVNQDGFYGINPSNGNTVWHRDFAWLSYPSISKSPGTIYFSDHVQNTLRALNTTNGSTRWETAANEYHIIYAKQKIYSFDYNRVYIRNASNGQLSSSVTLNGLLHGIGRPTIRLNDSTYYLFEHGNFK